jgi:hypothetical protein
VPDFGNRRTGSRRWVTGSSRSARFGCGRIRVSIAISCKVPVGALHRFSSVPGRFREIARPGDSAKVARRPSPCTSPASVAGKGRSPLCGSDRAPGCRASCSQGQVRRCSWLAFYRGRRPARRSGARLTRRSPGDRRFPPETARSFGIESTFEGPPRRTFPEPQSRRLREGVRPWRLRLSRTLCHRGPAWRWPFLREREQAFCKPLRRCRGFSTQTHAGNSFPEGRMSPWVYDSRRNPMNVIERSLKSGEWRLPARCPGDRP